MIAIATKTCNKCFTEYPATLEFFYRREHTKDGLRNECKKCCKWRVNVYRQIHKEQIGVRQKEYYQTIKGYLGFTYRSMKRRCENPKTHNYGGYGGRGIQCLFTSDEFIGYVVNELQIDPRGKQCHRVNNDSHYERGNIEFLAQKQHTEKHKKAVSGRC